MSGQAVAACQCPQTTHRHGTRSAYRAHGCRCTLCRVANAEYAKARRYGVKAVRDVGVDPTGTIRRLRALAAVGWGWTAIAGKTGIYPEHLWRLSKDVPPKVHRSTAGKITALYDEVWGLEPPRETSAQRHNATYARNIARKRGWAPPMAWDDDGIDDPDAQPSDPQYLDYPSRCRLARELLSIGVDVQSASRSAMVSYKTAQKIKREEAA